MMATKPPAVTVVARILPPLLGAPLTAFTIGAATIAGWIELFPASAPFAFAVGTNAILPIWVALGCTLPLARSCRAAWKACLSLAFPALVVLVVTWAR